MSQLRPYQQRAIDDLYRWFNSNATGNPCLVLPTGAGKSWVIAKLCEQAIKSWPNTRILMLAHQKELIEQNAEKLRIAWPNAPLGICSASIGKRELGLPITFASIQSVARRAQQIGRIDLILVDECHRISHKNQGGYRKLIAELTAINPRLRVIGLTATPYRLGHGLITDEPAIFDALLESVTVQELVDDGYLSPLRSKHTDAALDTHGVHKRGGEFVESELQAAVNTADNNAATCAEIVRRAEGRKSWLLFCAGVAHAEAIRDELVRLGVRAECLTGQNSKGERERILSAYKAGEITALTNCDILTTGFDNPRIDLIAMLRPTMSASLYVQMAGRGLRIADGKDDCLVLDFAGNVAQHGPITCVEPPRKAGDGGGTAPVKTCQECGEIVHASVMICPACGYQWPKREKDLTLRQDDIMGYSPKTMDVTGWRWEVHKSRKSGIDMLSCRYYGGLSDPVVTEYVCLRHDGYAGRKAMQTLAEIADGCGLSLAPLADASLEQLAFALGGSQAPSALEYQREGKFYRVISRDWSHQREEKRA